MTVLLKMCDRQNLSKICLEAILDKLDTFFPTCHLRWAEGQGA